MAFGLFFWHFILCFEGSFRHLACSFRRSEGSFRRLTCSFRRSGLSFRRSPFFPSLWPFYPRL
ncbi:hypothetical protein [Lysinibacillus sphaericus]|uniref:hypothetical protein n=1 Tax=Lysinibacillus sphaericus TaxID=1421 RepID=UPI001CBB08F2|nr:hypothetical protein [Lysinibacillus sphaericus]